MLVAVGGVVGGCWWSCCYVTHATCVVVEWLYGYMVVLCYMCEVDDDVVLVFDDDVVLVFDDVVLVFFRIGMCRFSESFSYFFILESFSFLILTIL